VNRRRRQISYDRIVIVGAGRAGTAAAEELREQGFRGDIAILCDEPDAPYDRPACSKGILTGKQRPRDVVLPMRHGGEVRWQLGRRAAGIDTRSQVVYTESDEAYEYDGLVIATGGHPITPPNWPHGEPGIHVLHGLGGAWGLRRELRDAERVAVIGGGLTGCETACAVRTLARDCVLIDSNQQVMTRAIGADVGGFINDEIRHSGVELRLGRRVQEVTRMRRRWRVRLDDGSDVDADLVVATIGERPNTAWLASAPEIDISDGVLCDENLRVVGAENIVAAGSLARWPNLRYGGPPARCGQWIAALEQGKAAARTLLASDAPAAPAVLLPRFWSDQFGLRIQVSGALLADAEVFLTEMRPGRRDVARAGVMASYVREGRLVGAVAVNAPRAFTSVTRALLAGAVLAEPAPVTLAPATTTTTTAPRRRLTAVA
jgi:NADPH-dependent 2,4-dienoyl-CoA reductase/sulfur reductase-like enzyme